MGRVTSTLVINVPLLTRARLDTVEYLMKKGIWPQDSFSRPNVCVQQVPMDPNLK